MTEPGRCSRLRFVACLALAALSLSTCAEDKNGRTTTIELWTLALSPTFDDFITSRIRSYESARAEDGETVRVEWVDVPFDALDRKLIAAAAANRAPDVVNFSDMTFARFVSLGALIDLRPYLPEETIQQYLPGARSIAEIDGQLLAVPWYLTTQTLIANERLLGDGGLEADDIAGTWDDLRARAVAFHERTGVHLFSLPMGRETVLLSAMLAEGVAPFAERDGRLVASFDTPKVVGFLEEWVRLFRAGGVPREAATGGFAHLIDLYQRRSIAAMNTSPNFLRRIRDEAPSVFDETVVAPAVTGRLRRSHIATMVLGVTSQSEHPEEAARLTAWMTSPDNQLAFARLVNILPSTPESLQHEHFDPPTSKAEDEAANRIAASRALAAHSLRSAVAFTPALATWPDLRRAFEDRFTRLLLDDNDSVTRAAADIQRSWASTLAAAAPADLSAIPRPLPASLEAPTRE
ncbi:MAG: extracellular solute-binding protein [Planctomycetota bacterium]